MHSHAAIVRLLATHADWDHLLGRLVFPEAPLGCAETTAERLNRELGGAQRDLRRFDEEHYVEGRRPLALGGAVNQGRQCEFTRDATLAFTRRRVTRSAG